MGYPKLQFRIYTYNRGIEVVLVDIQGKKIGKGVRLAPFMNRCGLYDRVFKMRNSGGNAVYQHYVMVNKKEYPIFYSSDVFGFHVNKLEQNCLDYNPIIEESNYLYSTFKKSR